MPLEKCILSTIYAWIIFLVMEIILLPHFLYILPNTFGLFPKAY